MENHKIYSVADAADAIGAHHRKIRDWLARSPNVSVGYKPQGRIYFDAREVVALSIARELIDARYLPDRAIASALRAVGAIPDKGPGTGCRAAFPLPTEDGYVRVGHDVLAGQHRSQIVIDIESMWTIIKVRLTRWAREKISD